MIKDKVALKGGYCTHLSLIVKTLVLVSTLLFTISCTSLLSGPVPPYATVESISVPVDVFTDLQVVLEPTSRTTTDDQYILALYENGKIRGLPPTITWSQPELNVSKKKIVHFPITREERRVYMGEDLRHIFTVKVFTYQEWVDLGNY